MTTIPIVFAFDNRLTMPAAVAIFSLLKSAHEDTFYDIFILHSEKESLDKDVIAKVSDRYANNRITYRTVGDIFDTAFEIRGITTPAYYRLLIPRIIPEYDKVIYSDADIIFRQDLSEVYSTELGNNYFAGVKDPGLNLSEDGLKHMSSLPGVTVGNYINSGFLLINTEKINKDNIVDRLITTAMNKWKFQDQDTVNIVCSGHIKFLPPKYNMSDYAYYYGLEHSEKLATLYPVTDFEEDIVDGNIHYNGHKPWKKWCVNFDIWWEYYRNSPIFDPKFYFDFYYSRLNEFDQLPLLKRIKILMRYFVYGIRKNP